MNDIEITNIDQLSTVIANLPEGNIAALMEENNNFFQQHKNKKISVDDIEDLLDALMRYRWYAPNQDHFDQFKKLGISRFAIENAVPLKEICFELSNLKESREVIIDDELKLISSIESVIHVNILSQSLKDLGLVSGKASREETLAYRTFNNFKRIKNERPNSARLLNNNTANLFTTLLKSKDIKWEHKKAFISDNLGNIDGNDFFNVTMNLVVTDYAVKNQISLENAKADFSKIFNGNTSPLLKNLPLSRDETNTFLRQFHIALFPFFRLILPEKKFLLERDYDHKEYENYEDYKAAKVMHLLS